MEAGGDTTEIGVVGARDSLGEDASQESVPASDETSGTSRKADPVLDSSTGVNEEVSIGACVLSIRFRVLFLLFRRI